MKNRIVIADALETALSKEGRRVVLLTGPWGSGKTHLWDSAIKPRLTNANPITISLFGTQSVDDIKARLLGASIWQHRLPMVSKGRLHEAADVSGSNCSALEVFTLAVRLRHACEGVRMNTRNRMTRSSYSRYTRLALP